MQKTFKYLLVYFLCFTKIYAQELGDEILIELNKTHSIQYYIYQLNEQIKHKVDSESLINRTTPEGLAQSYFSATNAQWVKNDYLDKKSNDSRDEQHFIRVKAFIKEKNYMKLISKYSFSHDGKQFCYVFYLLEIEGIDFKFPTLLSCVKENERWFIYNLSNQAPIRELLMQLKPSVFKTILSKEKTDDVFLNELIKKVTLKNGEISIPVLHENVKKWNEKKEQESLKKYTNY